MNPDYQKRESKAVSAILKQIPASLKQNRVKQTDGYESSYAYILVDWKKIGEVYKIKTVKIKD